MFDEVIEAANAPVTQAPAETDQSVQVTNQGFEMGADPTPGGPVVAVVLGEEVSAVDQPLLTQKAHAEDSEAECAIVPAADEGAGIGGNASSTRASRPTAPRTESDDTQDTAIAAETTTMAPGTADSLSNPTNTMSTSQPARPENLDDPDEINWEDRDLYFGEEPYDEPWDVSTPKTLALGYMRTRHFCNANDEADMGMPAFF